jgi:hypothetical protein
MNAKLETTAQNWAVIPQNKQGIFMYDGHHKTVLFTEAPTRIQGWLQDFFSKDN